LHSSIAGDGLPAVAWQQENVLNLIERVMRVMTHVNIGAALGLAAWVLWSAGPAMAGHTSAPSASTERWTLLNVPQAGPSTPMKLVPMEARDGAIALCHEPPPGILQADTAPTGADL
jgi:hypothetical protein